MNLRKVITKPGQLIILSRILHTSIENILVTSEDILRLWKLLILSPKIASSKTQVQMALKN